ncbi:hypothetical protein BDV18DRAFT_134143 [Aspergillus unguis]
MGLCIQRLYFRSDKMTTTSCPFANTSFKLDSKETLSEKHPEQQTNNESYSFPTIAEPNALRSILQQDIYLLGSLFTILCQFAHPGLAKGSYNHTQFGKRYQQRLQKTGCFLNVAVRGTEEEKKAIFKIVHKYHSRVKGDGYSADDPELHKWTAATLFMSIVLVKETFFGKMGTDEMETLLQECAIFGTSLRMPPEMWFQDLQEFWTYWDYNIATLEITDEAKSLVQGLLYPPQSKGLPFSMSIALPVVRNITINWLPSRLAREYGLTPGLASQAGYVGFVAWVKTVYPWVPVAWKGKLSRENMEDVRRGVEKIQRTGYWGTASA